ncbi:GNAT family N-acetyltransferase [Holosporaceae bacterium 'Namur']|nr:GNAT family N-acetyltransferase [Holosporaceae bacterium 'Namur']
MTYIVEQTLSPSGNDIDFLTRKINEEANKYGISEEAYQFAFFIRENGEKIIAGCNGSVIYGAIYTDQLWVDPEYRNKGLGRMLMKRVHSYGGEVGCNLATVTTLSFQAASSFYEKLGYKRDFERAGYSYNSKCIFLKKKL